MPAKQILFRQAVSAKIIAWMNILANTVKVTLAPRGAQCHCGACLWAIAGA
ncbi:MULTISPECIES: hypothetical protein [Nitrosomonas]|uniref:hypothetical protein n=1 Tax=Nitrosomonas TaxID=914 RepID=UPI000A59ABC0|nr:MULTISPECIES: hypothetical protein [Nitrosomonas]UVS61903.1 hypothetical protein NX761_01830 [Nitrosomonas sp. PLL12]